MSRYTDEEHRELKELMDELEGIEEVGSGRWRYPYDNVWDLALNAVKTLQFIAKSLDHASVVFHDVGPEPEGRCVECGTPLFEGEPVVTTSSGELCEICAQE